MSNPTDKTRWNSKVEAHRVHQELGGLASRFEANGLDSAPIQKAMKALAVVADEVQSKLDAEMEAKAKYHASVSPVASSLDALMRENEELKKRLAAR